MRAIRKIRKNRVKIPNFGDFKFLTEVFLAQKVPPVVVHGETAYINSVWFYILAVSIFKSEDVNIFSRESCRERYFERLSPSRKRRKKGYRRAKRKLRWIIEGRSPFAYQYERMGAGRFGRYVMDLCLEYIVLKRMLYYFRRAAGMERRAQRVFDYMKRTFPAVRLLYPEKMRRRVLQRVNNYSGVMDFKDWDKLKDSIKVSNPRYVHGVFDSTAGFADSPYMDTAKIYKDSYFEEEPSELEKMQKTQKRDWKNLFMYKAVRPENIAG